MSVGEVLAREERPAMVRFEKRPIEDKKASREAGCIVYKDEDFVLITPPYSKDIVEHKVDRWFDQVDKNVRNGKTKPEHRDYWRRCLEKWRRDEEIPLNGTSIKNMSHLLTPAQVKTCLAANILTIEGLAEANDQGLRRLGMGGIELKNKAVAHIKASKDTGQVVMENAALKKEVQTLTETVNNLQAKLQTLSNRFEAAPVSNEITANDIEITANDILEPASYEYKAVQPEKSPEERYIDKFGKKPHHLMKPETILKRLAE